MNAGDFRTTARRTSFDDSPGSTHNLVLGLVEPGSRVLEFGCASGYMSEALRDRLGASVVGVELDAEAAQLAAVHSECVLVDDAKGSTSRPSLGHQALTDRLFLTPRTLWHWRSIFRFVRKHPERLRTI